MEDDHIDTEDDLEMTVSIWEMTDFDMGDDSIEMGYLDTRSVGPLPPG